MAYEPYLSTGGTNNIISRDSNGNTYVNNVINGATVTVGSGAVTVTLTVSSTQYNTFVISGLGEIVVVLPNATTLTTGTNYFLNNGSNRNITLQTNGGATLTTLVPGASIRLQLLVNASSAGIWDYAWLAPSSAQWGTTGLNVTGFLQSSTLTANAPIVANASKQLTSTALTNGQLLIGNTGNAPTIGTLSTANGFNVANAAGTITLSNLRNAARYVVSKTAGEGGYTTIQSAITQAVSDGANVSNPATILIWPGVYTEDISLKDYVSLAAIVKGVSVNGNCTYSSGSGTVYLKNINFLTSLALPTLSVTSNVELNCDTCSFSSSGSTYNIFSNNSACSLNFDNCRFSTISSNNFDFIAFSIVFRNCFITNSFYNTTSYIRNSTEVAFYYCTINDFISCLDASSVTLSSCVVSSDDNACVDLSVSANLFLQNSTLSSFNPSTYFVSGSGSIAFATSTLLGTAQSLDPNLILIPGVTLTGFTSTNGGNSTSNALSIGSVFQNTNQNDHFITVYLYVTSATSGNILLGIGPSSLPTQQTIISSLTTATPMIIPVSIYLPSMYYASLTTSGSISVSISGQQSISV